MALHLPARILITITTMIRITNFAYGQLLLKMPLTINPIAQDAITLRGSIFEHFYRSDPEYYSRLTPADIVMQLNNSLSFVMRKNIAGAVVLGVAAKAAGLEADQLNYDHNDSWTVNILLSDIQSILTEAEKHLLPLSDNITLTRLQELGLRVLQKRYNVSLGEIAEPLHSSTATSFQSIRQDWIRVVNFITKTNVNRLAARYEVSASKLAEAMEVSSDELYDMTLDQLDGLLSTEFKFAKGSLEVVVSTVTSTAKTTQGTSTAQGTSTPEQSTLGTTTSEQSTSGTTTPKQTTTEATTPNESTPKTTASDQSTSAETPTVTGDTETQLTTTDRPTDSPTTISTLFNSLSTGRLSLQTTKSPSLKTSPVGRPTQESSSDGATTNLAMYVGAGAGLLLLLVAGTIVWCFRRKRRQHSSIGKKNKPKNNNVTKLNNFWIEKNDSELQPHQEELALEEQMQFVRSPRGSIAGLDSRFKGLKYVPTASTFDSNASLTKMNNSRHTFENDSRREIFV